MTKLLTNAYAWLFRGVRTRNVALTVAGATLAALRYVRRTSRGGELLWSKTLRPGDTFRVRLLGPDDEVESEVDVEA